ncbi:DegV family protein [Lawsonibacter sp. LCP25S3_G6]|uniref:DegV family protein n=1 Tax=unclassified Lawsonibacter TaxID=2617946 RepID=UPI003F94B9B9
MARIKFSTDSAADLPAQLRDELSIQVLPFPIAMGDEEYEDGVDFTPDEFFDMLLSAPQIPTHAQLNAYIFTECFENAWSEGYTDLIHVSINSKGSATFSNALQARDDFYQHHPDAKETFHIHLIDSKTYTMAYGWAVAQGVNMAAAGKEAEEIVAYIQDWLDHARVVFAPLDLRFAKKSGRISAAAAFMGEALGLKPIMTFVDGESKILSKVRGEKNVISTIVDMCRKERQSGTPYLLVRGNNQEQSARLREACQAALGEPTALEYPIGGVVAINAGPNLVGIVYRT